MDFTKKLLNICIPTYNRINALSILVSDILKSDDDRFIITIQDNASNDNTSSYFNDIDDSRVVYRCNTSNFGAIENYRLSLVNSDTEYVLFVIDKDHINVEYLSKFIDFLSDKKPNFGGVRLNLIEDKSDFIHYEKGIESIQKFAYNSMHPTGFFYRSQLITNEWNGQYMKDLPNGFPFPFELINGHLGALYSSYEVIMPLLRQEDEETTQKSPTLTYNKADNLFFGATKRIEAFEVYIKDSLALPISQNEKKHINERLFCITLSQITISLSKAFNNETTIKHYKLMKRNVSLSEMFNNILVLERKISQIPNNYIGVIFSFLNITKCVIKCLLYKLHITNF